MGTYPGYLTAARLFNPQKVDITIIMIKYHHYAHNICKFGWAVHYHIVLIKNTEFIG